MLVALGSRVGNIVGVGVLVGVDVDVLVAVEVAVIVIVLVGLMVVIVAVLVNVALAYFTSGGRSVALRCRLGGLQDVSFNTNSVIHIFNQFDVIDGRFTLFV